METEVKNSFRPGYNKHLGFGLILMLVGGIYLGFNFGLIPMELKNVIISWQMLVIVIGLVKLIQGRFMPGIIAIFVGGFFIIPLVNPILDGQFIHIYWPLLLIAAGIVILIQHTFGTKWGFERWGNKKWGNKWNQHEYSKYYMHQHQNDSPKYEYNPEGFSKNSVFGSGDHIVLDPEFKGGELNAVFGGLTLDLRRTNLPEGETRLDVNAVFGGITIFVPVDWYVETHMDAVFGGFQDNRLPKEPLDTTRKLIITGSCVFGGGELRN